MDGPLPVYVDNARIKFGRMKMCHMIADTTEELLKMATLIEINHKWIQNRCTYREHFDICLSKRQLAIESGAIPISQRELGLKLIAKRKITEI